MCRVLKVSRSGYYSWVKTANTIQSGHKMRLETHIKAIYQKHKGRYGSPRIFHELVDAGFNVSKTEVARRMNYLGLKSIARKRYKITTDSKHSYAVAGNLLQRAFSVSAPNTAWVSDITYIMTGKGWLYLTVFIDLYSRMVVGWTISDSLESRHVQKALQRAIQRRKPKAGLIIHSDRGVQYACEDFRKIIDSHFFIQSMSRKGNCWDNAVAESFFHTVKAELIHHKTFRDKNDALTALFEYIEVYYNKKRKHSTLNYRTPAQVEYSTKTEVCF